MHMSLGGVRKFTPSGVVVLLGILAVLLVGCGGSSSTAGGALPDSQQIFRGQLVSGSTDIKTMDPSLVQDAYSIVPIGMVFPALLTLNGAGAPVPYAAAAMPTFNTASNTYTFQVRPGLKWSDGSAINADSFAYSINRSLSPCTASTVAYYLFAIKDATTFNTETCTNGNVAGIPTLIGDSVNVVGTDTLSITLNSAAPYFLEALTYPTSYAEPQNLITQYGSKDWTNHLADGSGFGGAEYVVKLWDHAGHIDLVRNPNFWGTAPKLKEVDFNIYESPDAEYADYLDGKIDEGTAPDSQYKTSATRSDFHENGALWINYYQPTWTKAPFNDIRVRQAFDLAINKTVLANNVDQGTEIPTNHIVPNGMPGYDPSLVGPDGTTNLTGNVAKATALMQAYANDKCGGKMSACPPVTLVSPNNDPYPTQDAAVVQMWETAFPGYPIKTDFIDFNTLITIIYTPNVPQIYDIAWIADYPDPQDWLSLQFSATATNNAGFVVDPAANALMAEADTDLGSDRMSLYNQAEQSLVTQVAWIPYAQQKQYWNVPTYVHNYTLPSQGLVPQIGSESWDTIYLSSH